MRNSLVHNSKLWLGIWLLLFFLFFLRAAVFLDPDFGWNLRYGEIYLHQGVTGVDPFSYTMSEFYFANPNWLADVIFSWLNSIGGYYFLAGFFSLVQLVTVYFLQKKADRSWKPVIIISCVTIFLYFGGIRPQVFSWLFFALLVYLLSNKTKYVKFYFVLPLLFWLWANIHGAFVLGLLIFLLLGLVSLRDNAWIKYFLFSVLLTFLTPFGINIWKYVVGQTYLFTRFNEGTIDWSPGINFLSPTYILFVSFMVFLVLSNLKKIPKMLSAVILGILLMAIRTKRNIPFLIILLAGYFPMLITFAEEKVNKNNIALKRLVVAKKYFLYILLAVFLLDLSVIYKQALAVSENNYFPVKAVDYLKAHSFSGKIFNYFSWGGYLIWKLPDEKVFIDGRMPSWVVNRGIETAFSAKDEYTKFLLKPDYMENLSAKYDITVLLLPPPAENSLLKKYLDNYGWTLVFKDKNSVIYERGKTLVYNTQVTRRL